MRKNYTFVWALLLATLSVPVKTFSQACTLTQADLLAAPAGTFTIPAGQVLCITSDFCMGATSNWPGGCTNANINSLAVDGTLRIAENVNFRFSGSFNGSGTIEILDGAKIYITGSINCVSGMKIDAVDHSITTGTSSITLPTVCNAGGCDPAFANGYTPINIVFPGLGYTSNGGCTITGYPSTNVLLPVTLKGFTGFAEGSGIRLNWRTASEQNNKGFEVQRSAAGSNWETLGLVYSKAPDGNSSLPIDYSYTDNKASTSGANIYRLRQIDLNGYATFSNLIRVEALRSNEWRVNAAGNSIRIQVQSPAQQNVVISVVGAGGNTVYKASHSLNTGGNLIVIPAGNYAKGLHVVSMQSKSGDVRREKILLR
ncbi:hypothetical protein HHL16_12720 [Pseudoflavitalea sp. G-6-1-2]|uniref:hypothetical protein n=1 Tax=Pseudoflavitalea sp. G-6-1-2 TaxID=2728841 RepID=UPI00146DEA69|nr:hypothetical protein [Pseudoflavitalea sp. G-6-1-2]NML21746.1 hypothetical protein [Pseudoflavitalea sp. G-6-1-2]